MSLSSGSESQLRFSSPPVQQVVLGVYFRPAVELATVHLMPILNEWVRDYPRLDESAPVPGWRPRTESERKLSEGRRYVTPLFVLATADGQRSLQIQQDRLVLTWRFEAEGSPKKYDGYTSLRKELDLRVRQLQVSTQEVAGVEITPERTDATYQNLVDLPVPDFCVGVLTSWSENGNAAGLGTEYSGMRLAGFPDDDEFTETLVSIEDGPDGEGTDFTIDVERTLKDDEGYLAALDGAHATVIQTFIRLSSPSLRESWGEQQ